MIGSKCPPYTTQFARTTKIRDTLGDTLPDVLINIVTDYAEEYSAECVATPLKLDSNGKVLNTKENRTILAAIEFALKSPDFDPRAKGAIFENASSRYPEEINLIMEKIRKDNEKIYLNEVDFSGMKLTPFNFSEVSAVKANFSDVVIKELSGADLTGANFTRAYINDGNLSAAILNGTTLTETTISRTNCDRAKLSALTLDFVFLDELSMNNTTFSNVTFKGAALLQITSDDSELIKLLSAAAAYEMTGFTYPEST